MRRVLSSGFAVVSLMSLAGCEASRTEASPTLAPWFANRSVRVRGDQPPTPQQESIIKALEKCKEQLQSGFQTLSPTSPPSAVAKLADEHATGLNSADPMMTACPRDFLAAHSRHSKAWRNLHSILTRFPDAYAGTEFMDQLQLLFQGNDVRGRALGGDMIEAVGLVSNTHDELRLAAERHGVMSVDEK